MVEVFKTNVSHLEQAAILLTLLNDRFPGARFHFDLSDCDGVLRAEHDEINVNAIIQLMSCNGYNCIALE